MQKLFTNKTIEKLKYDLIREGLISYENLMKAEEASLNSGINTGQALINLNLLSERTLLEFIEDKLRIPYVNLDDYTLDSKSLGLIDSEDARKYKIIPLFKIEKVLTMAMADPLDLFVLQNIVHEADYTIEPVICSERSIKEAIEKHYFSDSNVFQVAVGEKTAMDWREELNDFSQNENQVKRIIYAIINQAICEGTHELCIEPIENGLQVKFKQKNLFVEKGEIPLLLVPLFLSSLKNLAGLDVGVSELPQLGKFSFLWENHEISIGVYTFPTVKGERVVLKMYKPPINLDDYKINSEKLEYLRKSIKKQGLILICGKEMIGKTSLIYSLLRDNANFANIITIESLVKYELSGINQCELKQSVGFNLEEALKYLEFQSPNVVYLEKVCLTSGIKYLESLVSSGSSVITECTEGNIKDFFNKYKHNTQLAQMLSCLVFVHNSGHVEVFSHSELTSFF